VTDLNGVPASAAMSPYANSADTPFTSIDGRAWRAPLTRMTTIAQSTQSLKRMAS